MSSLIRAQAGSPLEKDKLPALLQALTDKIKGRVKSAYIFGSASTGDFRPESDIDLIFVVEKATESFPRRAFEFTDLFEIYPKLDILVYTQEELN